VAESAKNQHLRDFRRRSIFDFCNNICQNRTWRLARETAWIVKDQDARGIGTIDGPAVRKDVGGDYALIVANRNQVLRFT